MIHIAGLPVVVGTRVRQRCAWCGETIDDGPDGPYPTWKVGALVHVDRGVIFTVDHPAGEPMPPDSCAAIDPNVTV